MIFPRLFTCPTLATANFKIGEYNAPINVNPVGGGSAGKGWVFDKFKNFLIKFPRVGNKRSIKSVKKAPTPGEKI